MPETKAVPLGVLQNPSGRVAGLYRLAQSRGEQYGPGWGCVQEEGSDCPSSAQHGACAGRLCGPGVQRDGSLRLLRLE